MYPLEFLLSGQGAGLASIPLLPGTHSFAFLVDHENHSSTAPHLASPLFHYEAATTPPIPLPTNPSQPPRHLSLHPSQCNLFLVDNVGCQSALLCHDSLERLHSGR